MTKIINGDLVLKKDLKIDEDLIVHGNIRCENGRWNIDARNIDAWDINARDIVAWNIICETRKKKTKNAKSCQTRMK